MPPAFDVVQHQYGAGAGRQLADRLLEFPAFGGAEWRFAGIRQQFVVAHADRIGTAGADVHQGHIDRQPVQPGAEGAFVTEPRQFLPGADECLLGEVFGAGVVVAGEPLQCAIDAAHVQRVQPLERVAVAGGCGTHIVAVMRGCRDRRHRTSGGGAGSNHLASLDAALRERV